MIFIFRRVAIPTATLERRGEKEIWQTHHLTTKAD
jgi:hypothetical protein